MTATTTTPAVAPAFPESDTWFVPPMPVPPDAMPTSRGLLALYQSNALNAWPRTAYEDWVYERPFFGRASLLLNSAEAIRHVLVDNAEAYTRTRATVRIIQPLLGDGLFLLEGPPWRRARRAIQPAFARRAVPGFAVATAETLDRRLPELANGTPVDMLTAMQHLTLEIAGRALFDFDMTRFGPALRQCIGTYGRCYGRPTLLDFVLPAWLPSPRDLGRRRFRRRWFRLLDEIIAERRHAPPPQGAGGSELFDRVAALGAGEGDDHHAAPRLRDHVATLLIAGHETTAVALFWATYLLANAPTWQERIAAEAASLDLSAAGAAAALGQLTVARAVLDEALRLYPPAFLIVRQAQQRDQMAGRTVEPGTVIMIAPWVLHRHHRLWDHPERFDPGRFLGGAPAVESFRFLPFGAGPRVCVGASFATTEATLILARLCRDFRIALATPEPVRPVAVITAQPDHPARFHLTRRA